MGGRSSEAAVLFRRWDAVCADEARLTRILGAVISTCTKTRPRWSLSLAQLSRRWLRKSDEAYWSVSLLCVCSQHLFSKLTLVGSSSTIRRIRILIHPWQRLCNLLEQHLDVVPRLGGCLDEHDVELLRLFLGFFRCHLSIDVESGEGKELRQCTVEEPNETMRWYLPLVAQICLVANEDNDHVVAALCSYVVDPFRCVLE